MLNLTSNPYAMLAIFGAGIALVIFVVRKKGLTDYIFKYQRIRVAEWLQDRSVVHLIAIALATLAVISALTIISMRVTNGEWMWEKEPISQKITTEAELNAAIAAGDITEAVIYRSDEEVHGYLQSGERFIVLIDEENINTIRKAFRETGVEPDLRAGVEGRSAIDGFMKAIIPAGLIIWVVIGTALFVIHFRNRKENGGLKGVFGKKNPYGATGLTEIKSSERSESEVIDEEEPITMADVAGCEGAKEATDELLEFVRDATRFEKTGAKIPKGYIFHGPPGTGKTLLARAIAHEAEIPFRFASGSEFMQMYVGVGPMRLRELYTDAQKAADEHGACIIFIDEFDALAASRGEGHDSGEHRRTISQFLTLLDGIRKKGAPVITIGATNRLEDIDPAVRRPGRFDEEIPFPLPKKLERLAILEIHAKGKPLVEDGNGAVNLLDIAGLSEGFSGSDLENLMNKAAIRAARNDREVILHEDLQESITHVIAGRERTMVRSKEDTYLTAYHEGAHALVATVLEEAKPVKEITVLPRAKSGGHVLTANDEDTWYVHQDQAMAEIAVAMAGMVAEERLFDGKFTSGPSADIKDATQRVRNAVYQYGWSEKIGPMSIEPDALLSDSLKVLAEEEVRRILNEAKAIAEYVVEQNSELLGRVAEKLIELETIRDENIIAELFEGAEIISIKVAVTETVS